MPHFLINKNCIKNDFIYLDDKETVNHLVSALRVREGEVVKFIDEDEIVYFASITEAGKNKLAAKIESSKKSERKLHFDLCALICILKPDGMNLAVQNAVQAGAKEIYTVFSDNCAVKKASVADKTDKWQKIGAEAFKQCERADMPQVFNLDTFENIFSKFKKENIIIFAEKYDTLDIKNAITSADKSEKILAVFGPEGGFSEAEFEYFKSKELKLVTLGNLIFKAPNAITAGLFGIAQNV